MRVGAASDKGRIREHNEDSCRIIHGNAGSPHIFVIADGMGGHSSGETASRLAVDHVFEYTKANPESFTNESLIRDNLVTMMRNTNKLVIECSESSELWRGMGTTLTVSVLMGNKLYIGHVGDSRVYVLSGNELKQITVDHSYIEELILTGEITREQARNHPEKNVITRAIGGIGDDVMVDTYMYELARNDYIIMCTDGLTNEVDDDEIKETVLNSVSPEEACDKLIKKANDNGGRDNITVIVAGFTGD